MIFPFMAACQNGLAGDVQLHAARELKPKEGCVIIQSHKMVEINVTQISWLKEKNCAFLILALQEVRLKIYYNKTVSF